MAAGEEASTEAGEALTAAASVVEDRAAAVATWVEAVIVAVVAAHVGDMAARVVDITAGAALDLHTEAGAPAVRMAAADSAALPAEGGSTANAADSAAEWVAARSIHGRDMPTREPELPMGAGTDLALQRRHAASLQTDLARALAAALGSALEGA